MDSWVAEAMMMRFVTPKMLTEHSKECPLGPGSCDKCYCHRKGPNWWCLSNYRRPFFRGIARLCLTKSVVLVRDERHGQLLLRFRAAVSDMTVVSGVLGVQKLDQGSKESV